MPETLLIRADASVAMGTGHVMRCLALAQAWQDAGGDVVFAMAEATPAIEQRLAREQCHLICLDGENSAELIDLAQRYSVRWVVLDAYHLSDRYQQDLIAAGFKILLIDDEGGRRYCADVILNQNPHAHDGLYAERRTETLLLLGTHFVLLRREFSGWRSHERKIPASACEVLVTMGGSDPGNLSLKVVEALVDMQGLQTTVVVGPGNPYQAELRRWECKSLAVVEDPADMPELMAQADISIIAAGGTLWEMLFLGCPVMSFARNKLQADILSDLAGKGTLDYLGSIAEFNRPSLVAAVCALAWDRARRCLMSQSGRTTIDGLGAERVCKILMERC